MKRLGFQLSHFVNQEIRTELCALETGMHSISYPVIRKVEDTYCMAAFVEHFTAEDLQKGIVNRPDTWAVADFNTGEIIERFNCADKDFIDRPLDQQIHYINQEAIMDQLFHERMFALLDRLRLSILTNNSFDIDLYNIYMDRLAMNVSQDLRPYYIALSKVDYADGYRKLVSA